MKYALIDGKKTEAIKNTKGICPSCSSELIAKCGDSKVHHWSHKGIRSCDLWWENETEWHRSWKRNFYTDWQEVVHFDKTGEKHIADVKTPSGWVLEFQHSFLTALERKSREVFYQTLIWVVDGTRRKNDKTKFMRLINESKRIPAEFPFFQLTFPDECRLIKEWRGHSLVLFDFKESSDSEDLELWFVFPKTQSSDAYLLSLHRAEFIELCKKDNIDKFINNTIKPMYEEIINKEKRLQQANMYNIASSLSGFDKHLRKIQYTKRRF